MAVSETEQDDLGTFYGTERGDAYSQGNISVDREQLIFLYVSMTDLNTFDP